MLTFALALIERIRTARLEARRERARRLVLARLGYDTRLAADMGLYPDAVFERRFPLESR